MLSDDGDKVGGVPLSADGAFRSRTVGITTYIRCTCMMMAVVVRRWCYKTGKRCEVG